MGHSVSKAADNAVKKSEAVKVKAARTDEQIIRDIDINLNAGLSVPPNDIRLLLKKYNELNARDAMTNEGGTDGN